MSYKDISSTTLHFTGKAKTEAPWCADHQTAMQSYGLTYVGGHGTYKTEALKRMQAEEAAKNAETEKKVREKLEKYKAEEAEIELQRARQDAEKKAAMEKFREEQIAKSSKKKTKKEEKGKDKEKKKKSKKEKKDKKDKQKSKKRKKSASHSSSSSSGSLNTRLKRVIEEQQKMAEQKRMKNDEVKAEDL
eukprot:gnl/MRDRNA2_/MRDRNA2_98191_c0_seq1.p1 gnl/MRDRNA2_/MRDRNA2_98191_c0~~gnl/MRDRNA2_/MRDRNA2_98191_c0_seq1.p1  ORF type:complete len:190 (+),score=71.40 gnl/MRDRNA2_/MRDRNA2_98191_c0_seq1:112-681(+)